MLFKHVGGVLMPLFGLMHGLDEGAKRYVDVLTDPKFETGRFYAGEGGAPTGPLFDQASLFDGFDDAAIQDNAREAVMRFVHESEAPLSVA